MSSSNKTLSLLTATALAAGLGMTASASALSMSDLAQGYLVAGQAAKASTDAKCSGVRYIRGELRDILPEDPGRRLTMAD
ncbi:hypothetical protein [Stenotrophomonas maltophilia]|uniref:hypothetical protein n=1 Tax=Stenotrophomonas maltophilia TaxID=40324 RepID=UPI000C160A3A|nr:hypothetical protein [Stenotrophomonas maltophilia]